MEANPDLHLCFEASGVLLILDCDENRTVPSLLVVVSWLTTKFFDQVFTFIFGLIPTLDCEDKISYCDIST